MSDHKTPKISIGITSLVVILTVLCLTIFCVLTLSTAMNERNLSKKSAEVIQKYYSVEADCAEIANELSAMVAQGGDVTALTSFARENDVDCKIDETVITFSYDRPIDEGQSLFVTLRLEDKLRITKWQIETTGTWEPDTSMPVWDGENLE